MQIYQIRLEASEHPENIRKIEQITEYCSKQVWHEPEPFVKAIFPHLEAGYHTINDSERIKVNPQGLLLGAIPHYYQHGINPLRTWSYSFVPGTLEGFENLFSEEIKLARDKRESFLRIFDGLERCLSERYDPDEQIFPERPTEHTYRETFQFGWNFACKRGNNSGIECSLRDVNSDTIGLVYAVFKEFIENARKDFIQRQLKRDGWSEKKVEEARQELEEKGWMFTFSDLIRYPHIDVTSILKPLLEDMRKKGLDVGYFRKIHHTYTVYRVTLGRNIESSGATVYSGSPNNACEIERLQRTFQDLKELCEGEGLEVKLSEDMQKESLSNFDPRVLSAPLQKIVKMML